MRMRPLHFKVDLISSLILKKNVKNVDFPILIYSIAPVQNHDAFPASLPNSIDALSSLITYQCIHPRGRLYKNLVKLNYS